VKKLSRPEAAPECLTSRDLEGRDWEALPSPCKAEVEEALARMQGQGAETTATCAYCEASLSPGRHIEHFRRRQCYRELTFAWDNLFLSCEGRGGRHCGHHKDKPHSKPYHPDNLIKPDEHDPRHFLYFYSNGSVDVRKSEALSEADRTRAEESIRVFNLNDPGLCRAREVAVARHKQHLMSDSDFAELMSWPLSHRQEYLRDEVAKAEEQPYAAAILDFLQRTCK
jgi:uncharacterized protein (TIGR02646 family)